MNAAAQKTLKQNKFSVAALAIFVAWTFYEGWLLFHHASNDDHRVFFLFAALLATLVSESRTLPWQNVLSAAVIIALLGGLVEVTGALTGIPFGSRIYLERFGARIFGILPWPVPILWVIFVLNSRGVARLILRPWRKSGSYGFRVIGLTCLLVVTIDPGFEAFAGHTNHFWIWRRGRDVLEWFGAPWLKFFGVGLTTLLILAFATPTLIDKHPTSTKRPPNYQPLILWLVTNFFFATANGVAKLQLAMIVGIIMSVVFGILAWRGAKW